MSDSPTAPPASSDSATGRHPIRVVAQRTGLKPDLIRAWERRYGAIKPQRSAGRHRFYSDDDIERLLLLKQAGSSARSIGRLADLDNQELRRLIDEDLKAQLGAFEPSFLAPSRTDEEERSIGRSLSRGSPPVSGVRDRSGSMAPTSALGPRLSDALDAVARLDSIALASRLDDATLRLGYSRALSELVEPLLHTAQRLRDEGQLREMHWRLVTCEVRAFVQSLTRRAPLEADAPIALVATPLGQKRELGALLMAAHIAEDGWRPLYLGPDLPASEIAAACRAGHAQAVILDLSFPKDDPDLGPQLLDLRHRLGRDIRLLVGGPALNGYAAFLQSPERTGKNAEAMATVSPVQNAEELKNLLIQLRKPWFRDRPTSPSAAAEPAVSASFGLRELPISSQARKAWQIDASLITSSGHLRVSDLRSVRRLVHRLNQIGEIADHEAPPFYAGRLKAAALIYEIYSQRLHQLCRRESGALVHRLDEIARIGGSRADSVLTRFEQLFPTGRLADSGSVDRRLPRHELLLRLFLLRALNQNPACAEARRLFDDRELTALPAARELYDEVRAAIDGASPVPIDAAQRAFPDSFVGQLQYLLENDSLSPDRRDRLWICLDVLHEEEAPSWEDLQSRPPIPHAPFVPSTTVDSGLGPGVDPRAEPRSEGWWRELVLVAKHVLVWLHQLSEAYGRPIRTLDQIPDEELDRLASLGLNGLWLVGLWRRSPASEKIKHLVGHTEARASAYSIYDYEVDSRLGGEPAKRDLERRALARGIRLACDMIPNHVGLDSRWVIEHPERLMQVDERPFPSYTFEGPDLSSDPRIGLFLEDHYRDQSDAAVVFQRVDRATGEVRFLYHGNDGTSLPWNDTAQLDHSRADVREAVIQQIVFLAKSYPILRLDAAMTLIRDHFQRLWFPEPGKGGAVPSRAEHQMSREAFAEKMPEELWREAVERVEREAPQTLLIAEGFWHTESYFIRELGMHRVYNSAFLHHLAEGNVGELIDGLKQTLVLDPSALDGWVNFLTHPDLPSAAERVGTGDRYFAFCVLMVTLPGLPLIGHGQIEGWTEQYAMDTSRPSISEPSSRDLETRFRREIVPLLRERRLFGSGSTFRLFEVQGAEDAVVAFVNGPVDGDRRLVVTNPTDRDVSGRIHTSAPVKQDSEATTVDLAEALGLPEDGTVTLQEVRHGDDRRIDCALCRSEGLELELHPWETRVFKVLT